MQTKLGKREMRIKELRLMSMKAWQFMHRKTASEESRKFWAEQYKKWETELFCLEYGIKEVTSNE